MNGAPNACSQGDGNQPHPLGVVTPPPDPEPLVWTSSALPSPPAGQSDQSDCPSSPDRSLMLCRLPSDSAPPIYPGPGIRHPLTPSQIAHPHRLHTPQIAHPHNTSTHYPPCPRFSSTVAVTTPPHAPEKSNWLLLATALQKATPSRTILR